MIPEKAAEGRQFQSLLALPDGPEWASVIKLAFLPGSNSGHSQLVFRFTSLLWNLLVTGPFAVVVAVVVVAVVAVNGVVVIVFVLCVSPSQSYSFHRSCISLLQELLLLLLPFFVVVVV